MYKIANQAFLFITLVFSLFILIGPATTHAAFEKDLKYGDRGPAVSELQEFLKDQSLFAGDISGNFFSFTLRAVKAFQVRENIYPVSGYWGPLTRAAAKRLLSYSSSENATESSVSTTTTNSNSTFSALQQQIAQLQAQILSMQNNTKQNNSSTQAAQNTSTTATSNTAGSANTSSSGGTNQSCNFNGSTIAHDSYTIAYQLPYVEAGSSCVSEKRFCTNGILSGSYKFSQCAANTTYTNSNSASNVVSTNTGTTPPLTCSFNGNTVAHGATVTAYQNNSVAAGLNCVSQTRTCTNGTLSGNYTYPSCQIAVPQNLSMANISEGTTVGHTFLNNHYVTGGKGPYSYKMLSGSLPPGITAHEVNDGSILRTEGTNMEIYPMTTLHHKYGYVRYSKWRVTDALGASYDFDLAFTSYYPNPNEPGRIEFTSNGQSDSSTIKVGSTNTYAWSSVGTSGCSMNWTFYPTGGTPKTGSLPNLASSGTMTTATMTSAEVGSWQVYMTCPITTGGSAPTWLTINVVP